jgi:hypothetical protein
MDEHVKRIFEKNEQQGTEEMLKAGINLNSSNFMQLI